MTKEENVATLNEHLEHWNRLLSEKICDQSDGEKTIDALQNAIKALEQEPCADCISREAVMHILDEVGGDFDSPREAVVPIDYIADMVSELSSVSPQPKMGRWTRELIRNEYGGCIGAKMICSECGQDNGYDKRMKFCPNCGSYNGGDTE